MCALLSRPMQGYFQATLQGGNTAEHLDLVCAVGIWKGVYLPKLLSKILSLTLKAFHSL